MTERRWIRKGKGWASVIWTLDLESELVQRNLSWYDLPDPDSPFVQGSHIADPWRYVEDGEYLIPLPVSVDHPIGALVNRLLEYTRSWDLLYSFLPEYTADTVFNTKVFRELQLTAWFTVRDADHQPRAFDLLRDAVASLALLTEVRRDQQNALEDLDGLYVETANGDELTWLGDLVYDALALLINLQNLGGQLSREYQQLIRYKKSPQSPMGYGGYHGFSIGGT